MIKKALHWAYGDSLKYIGFMLAMATFIGVLMTIIAYPVQTITFLVIGGAAYTMFTFFSEWN